MNDDNEPTPAVYMMFAVYPSDALTLIASHECTHCGVEHADRLQLEPEGGRIVADALLRILRAIRFDERSQRIDDEVSMVECVDDLLRRL